MPAIRIRRDGTLLVDEDGAGFVPLDPSDSLALLTHLRCFVTIEDGVTPARLLKALRPWSETLSRMAWMDYPHWLEALNRPCVFEASDPLELDAVAIQPVLTIKGTRGPLGASEATLKWRTFGRLANDGGMVSLSHTPPNSWSHLPLVIERRITVVDVPAEATGEQTVKSSGGGACVKLVGMPTFHDAIVMGFLDDVTIEDEAQDHPQQQPQASASDLAPAAARGASAAEGAPARRPD